MTLHAGDEESEHAHETTFGIEQRATRCALLELRIDEHGDVWSGGQVQTVIRGTIDW